MSRTEVSCEGVDEVTPLLKSRAKNFAVKKLKTPEQRKVYLKRDRYIYEVQHDYIVDHLERVFRQVFFNIYQEQRLLRQYTKCRGFQKTQLLEQAGFALSKKA